MVIHITEVFIAISKTIHAVSTRLKSSSVNSISTGMIPPGCLGEAKIAATTINVVNNCSTIFPSYLLFFKKTVSKTRL